MHANCLFRYSIHFTEHIETIEVETAMVPDASILVLVGDQVGVQFFILTNSHFLILTFPCILRLKPNHQVQTILEVKNSSFHSQSVEQAIAFCSLEASTRAPKNQWQTNNSYYLQVMFSKLLDVLQVSRKINGKQIIAIIYR